MDGWVKIYRNSLDHWLYSEYRPLTRREAWENLLLWANYEDSQILIKGQLVECKRGQLVFSLETYAQKFVWSISQVRTFFDLLVKDRMIKIEGLKYTTRLTICNYDKYQSESQTDSRLIADSLHSDNILVADSSQHTKNNKKIKNNILFIRPTLEEIKNYCNERKNSVDYERFFNYYESNGWMVGKSKMKDWQAAIRTWEKNNYSNGSYSKNPTINFEGNDNATKL